MDGLNLDIQISLHYTIMGLLGPVKAPLEPYVSSLALKDTQWKAAFPLGQSMHIAQTKSMGKNIGIYICNAYDCKLYRKLNT